MDSIPLKENHTELGRAILNIPISSFYKLFMADDGDYNHLKMQTFRGDRDITNEKWTDDIP